MVHPSSHQTPNEINEAVFIMGKMWICLACLLRPGIRSVAMCEDSILVPYGILADVSVDINTGAILVVACFARCMFAPESAISSMLLLGGLGGSSKQFIKIILGLLILILFVVSPNRHSHPFLLPTSIFL